MEQDAGQYVSARVLLVEDNPNLARTLLDLVEAEGFVVVGCATAAEALARVQQERFGIVILDLRLPDSDGIHLLNQLRSLDRVQRVIINTGFASLDSAKEAVNLGAFAYVEKAGDPEELVRYLHRAQAAYLRQYAEELESVVVARTLALQQSESDYRILMEQSVDGIFILDLQGNFTLVNAQACDMLGYTRDELEQMNVRDIVTSEVLPQIDPWLAELRRNAPLEIEYRLCCKNGVEKIMEVRACLLSDGRIQSSIRDITERKRVEEALRASELKFRSLCLASPVGIFLNEANGACVYVNESWQAIYGLTLAESLGDQWGQVLHPEDREFVFAQWRAYLQNLQEYEQEYRVLTPQGDLRWILFRIRPLWNDDGRVTGHVGVSEDITKRKHAEAMLQTLSRQLLEVQEQERRRIARELHDEIGQTLTAVKINLQTLQRLRRFSKKQLEDSVTIVELALQQVRTLSLDLRPPMLDDLGLAAALRWYVHQQAQRIGGTLHLTFGLFSSRPAQEIETACFRIVQEAVTNIIRHAQATDVAIDVREEDMALHVTVRDNGHAFDVRNARERAASGASLGLLSMQERAQLVGGQLHITSLPGEGTVVHAYFPLSPRGAENGGHASHIS